MPSAASPDTDVDLETWVHDDVPCTGIDHGRDPKLHGDPDMPAEYMVGYRCCHCGYNGRRPTCAFFALGIGTRKRKVICPTCDVRVVEEAYFHILWKL